jgi:hypothetical protein
MNSIQSAFTIAAICSALTVNQIVLNIMAEKIIHQAAYNINRYNYEDLKQELWLHFLTMPEEKLRQLYMDEWHIGHALKFFARKNMPDKKNRKYSLKKVYIKEDSLFEQLHYDEYAIDDQPYIIDQLKELLPIISNIMSTVHWYDRLILQLYIEEGSIRKLSAKTKIPVKSIHDTITKTRQYILSGLNKNNSYDHI